MDWLVGTCGVAHEGWGEVEEEKEEKVQRQLKENQKGAEEKSVLLHLFIYRRCDHGHDHDDSWSSSSSAYRTFLGEPLTPPQWFLCTAASPNHYQPDGDCYDDDDGDDDGDDDDDDDDDDDNDDDDKVGLLGGLKQVSRFK